ncbi:branched-chain amino acid ABC transporter substrate-binding protein [Jatrophihabitans sp. YIM 134969]
MQKRLVGQILALSAAGALALTACSNGSGGGGGGLASGGNNGGSDTNATYKIGFEGPLSGDNQQLGINEVNAVELAIDQANESGDLPFKLELVKADDVGDPAQAPTAAATLLQDTGVLGVVGPSFSGATKAVANSYGEANLVLISPSATNDTLTSEGFKAFHRVVPPDGLEGKELADHLVAKGYSKVVVIDDGSDYGTGVADTVEAGIKAGGKQVQRISVLADTKDYGPTAQTIAGSGAQAFFYGGYDAQAALLAKAVAATSYSGDKYTGNGGKSSVFTSGAGDAGNGWFFSCGCADATTAPEAKDFTSAYKAKWNTDPSTYSPEAYDATNAMIEAFKEAAKDGAPTRQSVFDAVNKLDYKGITTTVKFQENGELDASSQVINLFEQEDGVIKTLGNIQDQS